MFRRFTSILAASALLATASAQQYAQQVQTINAGIVILDADHTSTQSYGHCAAPFAIFNLDQATNVKPAGWTFVNPYSISTVTATEQARWIEATNNGSLGPYPAINDPVTKRTAAYWEVHLDSLSDAQMATYNFLLINPGVYLSLNTFEREKIRRFVDAGGVLMVDSGNLSTTTGVDQVNPTPAPFALVTGSANGAQYSDFNQTLLQKPYALTQGDLTLINENFTNSLGPINLATDSASSLAPLFGSVYADYFAAEPFSLVSNGATAQPTGTVTRIGEGFVVNASRGLSIKLNTPAGQTYNANLGYYPLVGNHGVTLSLEGFAAAKFAINAISLATEYRQSRGGSRGSGSGAIDAHAPLLNSFSLEGASPASSTTPQVRPVFYKGLMVVSSGGQLFVFNAHPGSNLDGDPLNDLGIADHALGAPYDLVWSSATVGSALSTPVCAEVPDADGTPVDQVFATDANGNLHGWNLTLRNGSGYYEADTARPEISNGTANYPIAPPTGAGVLPPGLGVPIAPTVHEGVVYVTDNQESLGSYIGRIWLVDARTGLKLNTGQSNWAIGGEPAASASPGEFSGSPVVGYIPIYDNSGGSDKVVYVPTMPTAATSCGVTSLWVGARGESPSAVQIQNTLLVVTTRASAANIPIYTPEVSDTGTAAPDPRGVKLTLLDVNGNPMSDKTMAQYFSGTVTTDASNNLDFTLTAAGASTLATDIANNVVSFRVDYTINWGHTGLAYGDITASVTRAKLAFPDKTVNPQRQVLGGLALSPMGTVFATVSDPSAAEIGGGSNGDYGGGFFAVREQGRGVMNIVNRWEVYPQHNIVLNQASPVSYDEVLYDTDPVNAFVDSGIAFGASDRRLRNFVLTGAPTVRNGQVFVTAMGQKYFDIGGLHILANVSILLAFQAEPPTPTITNVSVFPAGSSLIQPDFALSSSASVAAGTPDTQANLTTTTDTNLVYDPTYGTIQLTSLASTTSGRITECLSLSQPVILRRPGSPDELIDPSATGGSWTPLLWYQTYEGSYTLPGSNPVVTGDTVFVGMNSYLPNGLINNNWLAPAGIITATQAQIAPNDPYLFSVDYTNNAPTPRPWLHQLWTIVPGGNPHVLWPQSTSITSPSQFAVSLAATTLGSSVYSYGLAAGEGSLAIVGDKGLYAFDRANFLVCDEGRVTRFDPGGNPISTAQSFENSGAGGITNSQLSKPLVRPTKAYDLGQNGMLIVDTGGSRIVSVDQTGKELRSIDKFILDPNHLPDGYKGNESGFASESDRLKEPSDVVTFSDFVSPTPVIASNQTAEEYWVHYLVADKGNHRLIELVDRFSVTTDPVTGLPSVGNPIYVTETKVDSSTHKVNTINVPQLGVLMWHSPSNVSGRGFDYNSVNRVYVPGANGAPDRFVYVAGVGNASGEQATQVGPSNPTQVGIVGPGAGTAGLGGIVIFDQYTPGTAFLVNSMTGLPNLKNVAFWDDSLPSSSWNPTDLAWDTTTSASRTNLTASGNPILRPFNNVSSVTSKLLINGGVPEIEIMVAEADGVYEVEYNTAQSLAQTVPQSLPINWMIPNQAYRVLRHVGTYGQPDGSNPMDLRATYAKRLDNGDVLIVNGYRGNYRSGASGFNGEVVEIAGNAYNPTAVNLGYYTGSIRYSLPPVQGIRGLVLPTFAERD